MDPAYSEIGPQSCVGMTGNWASYSWPPAIILTTVMLMFLLDFSVERYVEMKYGVDHTHGGLEQFITGTADEHAGLDGGKDVDDIIEVPTTTTEPVAESKKADSKPTTSLMDEEKGEAIAYRSFRREIAAFLILEFGVIFHSVIIGLNLGTAGSEFTTLYPVIVFHQSFEGLGIGARMSAIPFPSRWSWLQWSLCAGYGLTTPIAIAIGLGLRTQYNPGSFTANVVSGTFDSLSAGVLIYTGLVELLARDFLFNPKRTMDNRKLAFMVVCTFLGAGVMALLGKWA
jgi:solute carrier family 39 (zinc transporter), member 1/2/3